jgi:uncharacterized membrane protein YccC
VSGLPAAPSGHHRSMNRGLNGVLGVIVLFLGLLAVIQWSLTFGLVLAAIGLVQSGIGVWIYEQRSGRNASAARQK